MGYVGDYRHIENLEPGVAGDLGQDELGVISNSCSESVGTARIHKGCGDAETRQRDVQHVMRAAIDVLAGNDVAAGVHQRGDGHEQRCLTTRCADGCCAVL